jgi:hypothetical protein
VGVGVEVGREVAWVFGSQEGAVLVPAMVLVFKGAAAAAASAITSRLPANAADVDEQRIFIA